MKSQGDSIEVNTSVKSIYTIISSLCSHVSIKSQPGVKSIVQYYNNVATKTSNDTIDINNIVVVVPTATVSGVKRANDSENAMDEVTVEKSNKKQKKSKK